MPFLRSFACASALFILLPCCNAQVTFSSPQTLATGFQRLAGYAVGDFNGDGKPDLAFTDSHDKRVVVYLNNGKGGFGAPVSTSLNVQYVVGGISAGDINEDGKQDLIVSATGTSQANYILISNGDGTFTTSGIMPDSYGFFQGVFADLNGDKHLDFVCAGNPQLYAWLGDGKGKFTAKPIQSQSSDGPLFSLVVADFNRDDKPDVIAADFGNPNSGVAGSLRFLPGVGDGTFGNATVIKPLPASGGYDFLASADFNGDGKRDLAYSLPTIASIASGNGDGTFQIGPTQMVYPPQGDASMFPNDNSAPPLAVADFDGNGTADIAIAEVAAKQIFVSLNDGTGTFSQGNANFQASVDADTFFVMTADLNGDGLPDIITGSYTTNNVLVFLSKLIQTAPTITLSASASQVTPGTSITLTAKVSGTGGVPTGSIVFADGTTTLATVALDANGQAGYTTSNLAAGQHSITATYSGDTRFTTASSSAAVVSVVDFALSLGTASQSIRPGGTATYSLTLSGAGGLTGAVALSCSGLPAGYTCTSTGATLGAQPVTATVTVSPAAHAFARPVVLPFQLSSGITLAVLPLGFCLVVPRRRMRRGAGLLCAVAWTVGSLWVLGCGGSSSTYHGTSTFTINATTSVGAQTLSHQTTATLTVQ